jgi:adenosylcobinamide-GDP ribazoletransferase
MLRGLVTAGRTLTILPVPGRDADDVASALPWFPIVGLLLGGILYGAACLPLPVPWHEGVAVLLLALGSLLTRGLHLDGLSDWADGFWGARDRDRVLEIMKDSSIGTFGGTALVCVLLAKWVCFVRILDVGSLQWIPAAYIISRVAQIDLAVSQPYARSEEGTGSPFISGARWHHLLIGALLGCLLLGGMFRSDFTWVIAGVAALLIARLFGLWCRRRVNGVTGDLLGACSEIVEVVVLTAGAVSG